MSILPTLLETRELYNLNSLRVEMIERIDLVVIVLWVIVLGNCVVGICVGVVVLGGCVGWLCCGWLCWVIELWLWRDVGVHVHVQATPPTRAVFRICP
jgi:hypothetical protein